MGDLVTRPIACWCRTCLDGIEPAPGQSHFPTRWTQMVVCALCGNKRCPKAENHRYLCTGSNDLDQEEAFFILIKPNAEGRSDGNISTVSLTDPILPPASVNKSSAQIRIEMALQGWSSEDRLMPARPDRPALYKVIFHRNDWRGLDGPYLLKAPTYFSAQTTNLDDIARTVAHAALIAQTAWERFPVSPPLQLYTGQLEVAPPT